MKKKVLLAFSGGLDTSFCVKYLLNEKGAELITLTVDTGGFSNEELSSIEARALQLGSSKHYNISVAEDYYRHFIKFLVFGNILKNNTYPLSVSAERVMQAVTIAKYAKDFEVDAIAHGSTGAGNDQVRFDTIFQTLCPELEIITPIRELRLSRQEEIEYLSKHGYKQSFEKAKYSINQGLWGTSVGGAETLTSNTFLPESAWPVQATDNPPQTIELGFENGEPISLNGTPYSSKVELIRHLHSLAAPYGIGRDIHVGDTIIGIKGRVGFEASAPLIIINAHRLLEKHILSKQQMFWKDQMANLYGNWLHEGLYLDPVMRDIEAMMASSQRRVSGTVHIELSYKNYTLLGIDSPNDLMKSKAGVYGEMNNHWTGEDVQGFIKIYGNQNKIYHSVATETEIPFLK